MSKADFTFWCCLVVEGFRLLEQNYLGDDEYQYLIQRCSQNANWQHMQFSLRLLSYHISVTPTTDSSCIVYDPRPEEEDYFRHTCLQRQPYVSFHFWLSTHPSSHQSWPFASRCLSSSTSHRSAPEVPSSLQSVQPLSYSIWHVSHPYHAWEYCHFSPNRDQFCFLAPFLWSWYLENPT